MVLQSNHRLSSRQRSESRADRSDSLDNSGMHSSVDDSVGLQMIRTNFQLGLNFVSGGTKEMESHGSTPTSQRVVQCSGKISVG